MKTRKENVDKFDIAFMIEDTLNNFDFGKVKKVMEALDWKWYLGGGLYVPHHIELVSQASRLLGTACRDSIKSKESCTVGTGGFWATVDASDGYVRLWFEVASWESWNED